MGPTYTASVVSKLLPIVSIVIWPFTVDCHVYQTDLFDDANLDPDDLRLPEVRTDTWGGCVFLNFDDTAPPLREVIEPFGSFHDAWIVEDLRAEWWLAAALPGSPNVCTSMLAPLMGLDDPGTTTCSLLTGALVPMPTFPLARTIILIALLFSKVAIVSPDEALAAFARNPFTPPLTSSE